MVKFRYTLHCFGVWPWSIGCVALEHQAGATALVVVFSGSAKGGRFMFTPNLLAQVLPRWWLRHDSDGDSDVTRNVGCRFELVGRIGVGLVGQGGCILLAPGSAQQQKLPVSLSDWDVGGGRW